MTCREPAREPKPGQWYREAHASAAYCGDWILAVNDDEGEDRWRGVIRCGSTLLPVQGPRERPFKSREAAERATLTEALRRHAVIGRALEAIRAAT